MHELSIALALVTQLEELALKNNLSHIDDVFVEAGELRGIVPEALDLAFAETCHGTIVENAILHLKILRAQARCRKCQLLFVPTIDDYRCTFCKMADVSLEVGDQITLTAVEGRSLDF